MNISNMLVLVFLVCCVVPPLAPAHSQTLHEQKVFDSESLRVDRPVTIAPNILNFIAHDPNVKRVIAYYGKPLNKVPEEWLRASAISVASSSERVYLVIADGPLAGAHATTFWLIKLQKDQQVSLLFSITADVLRIGDIDGSGYPKITATQLTGDSIRDLIYQYVGKKYVRVGAPE